MTGGSSLSETVTALASSFTGQLLLPGDADYDEAKSTSGRRSSPAAAVWPIKRAISPG